MNFEPEIQEIERRMKADGNTTCTDDIINGLGFIKGIAGMTKEKLESYIGLMREIAALQLQIKTLYRPIKSPTSSESHSTTPGDPTAIAADRIMELKRKVSEEADELADQAKEIEDWLHTIKDHEITAIIRNHYINGMTWAEVDEAMYGQGDGSLSRRKFKKFMKRLNNKSSQH